MFHFATIFILAVSTSTTVILVDAESKIVVSARPEDHSVGENVLSEEAQRNIYNYIKDTPAFLNFTLEDAKSYIAELDTWEPPQELKENYPYYLAGYDYENRPIWVVEIGKLNFRRIVEQGEKSIANGKKYLVQALFNMMRSFVARASQSQEDEMKGALMIFDMDEASVRQVTYLPSWALFIELSRKYGELVEKIVGRIILVNSNAVTKTAADIARPVVGQFMERVEIYGSNRNIWLPRLLQLFSIKALPPWYGGNKNFKPISVYG